MPNSADFTPMRVVFVTLDNHLAKVIHQAEEALQHDVPGLTVGLHAAAEWENNPAALERCKADIAEADIIVATMLFIDDQIRAIRPAIEARRDACDAVVVAMSAGDIIKLTRMGGFAMDKPQKGPLALLKKLRGNKKSSASSGAGQMRLLRRLPKLLKYIPGDAQDVRTYFLTLQYWLAGSGENIANLVRMLVNRYADGERAHLRGTLDPAPPVEYPEQGVYHPDLPQRMAEDAAAVAGPKGAEATVGLVVLRSYILAGDTGHYDGVIRALEARGLRPVAVFANGLDARPAIEAFLMKDGRATVDAVISLTGFSLVGGPAYNDSAAAEAFLAKLDVPYLTGQPIEFQTLDAWGSSPGGLSPVESTIMIAIPELDGATAPTVFGGRPGNDAACSGCDRECHFPAVTGATQMIACPERADMLAARAEKLIALRRAEKAERKIAIVLFDFPPNSGAAGTAAYLSVFESLHRTLSSLKADGYDVDVPPTVDALRESLLCGNADSFGTDGNVVAQIPVDDHVRRERYLAAIEGTWGSAPGKQLTDGRSLFVLGAEFGNVFVGLQPAFGYEGDPMRLLFEKGFAPTHAFSAFYRYLREDFGAHAVLHFGTHGALEFMPGKQTGPSGTCWPDRLIGDLPNYNLYAANNPSEGALAKRRAAATLISYRTPPLAEAGLYKGLIDLKASLERWRGREPAQAGSESEADLIALIEEQAGALDLAIDRDAADLDSAFAALAAQIYEMEQELIPEGLHVFGTTLPDAERRDLLLAMVRDHEVGTPSVASIEAIIAGKSAAEAAKLSGLPKGEKRDALFAMLERADRNLQTENEMPALLHALGAGYIPPAPGGDLLRNPDVLPTGRNLHGFDPFKLPSRFALADGAAQAQRVLDRHVADHGALPESIALVLWGTDNLKSEGGPIGQALALMGATARFDAYGRLCGAELLPLEDLDRPRIDVIISVSGIFRDLLPLQIRMLAEAALLAAQADEPADQNFIRKHALDYQRQHGCDLETAALRVFSNADGAYGANVNQLIDSGAWEEGDELADAYEARKCFAYGCDGQPQKQPELLSQTLKSVDLAYQNLDSLELGVTTIDHYVDTLGGISRAVRRAKGGEDPAVYIGDQTQGAGKVRSLAEQVSLETRTRTLNPRWYEGLLKHGYEGVRNIEAQVTNTMGWSATTGGVDGWVYQKITETYVLDPEMRARLAELNPKASARLASRLMEAHERNFWQPDDATLEALQDASDELEDRLEGITPDAAITSIAAE